MNRLNPLMRSALAVVVLACSVQAQTAEPKLAPDGWVSWEVATPEDTPAWCCFDTWSDRDGGVPRACKLDGQVNGYGSRRQETTDAVRIYARSAGGKLDRVHVLAASCAVTTKSPVAQLEGVTPEDSVRWLTQQMSLASQSGARHDARDNLLAALSMHRNGLAREALVSFGSKAADSDTRSKAWFWLAMSGVAGAEAPITAAVRGDPNDGVREQAVFALSRLPDERAVHSLIDVAEDRSLPREERKRAVFWLSQSESSTALAYLDKVLLR